MSDTRYREARLAVHPLDLASAVFVALGAPHADPIIGLVITVVILRITWQSWKTVSTSDPGEMIELHEH